MDNEEKLKEQIMTKINELVNEGRVKDGNAYFEELIENAKRAYPYMVDSGLLTLIAKGINATVPQEPRGDEPETFCKIGELKKYVNYRGNENISIKGKVISASIDRREKKDEDGEWIIAKTEMGDDTGTTLYTQFYFEKYGSLFHMIETDELVGKILALHNVTVNVSKFTVHDTEIKLKKGGYIDLVDDEEITVPEQKYEPIKVNDAAKDEYNLFFLKVMNIEIKEKEGRNNWHKVNTVDEEGSWLSINLWTCDKFTRSFKIEKGDTLLVEGRLEQREWDGKIYKQINVNDLSKVKINPEEYTFTREEPECLVKGLENVLIGEKIETIVMIERIFKMKPYYLACPVETGGKICMKSVSIEDGKCNANHVLSRDELKKVKTVGIFSGNMEAVGSGIKIPFKIFDREDKLIKKITDMSTEQLANIYTKKGEEQYDIIVNEIAKKKVFKIVAIVIEDDYRGSITLKINDVEEVNIINEINDIKESIKMTI